MRFLTVLLASLFSFAAAAVATTDRSIPESPPIMMRTFSSKPAVAVSTPPPVAPIRPVLTATTGSSSLGMKLLVLDGDTSEISYQAITAFLGQIGVPYDAVVLSGLKPDASGNRLAGLALSSSASQGNYQGIILTDSTFGVCNGSTCSSLLSAADWSKLDTYAIQFNVRIVSYFTWPEARWGLQAVDSGASYLSTNALQATLTAAGAAVFPYLNAANPLPIAGNDSSGIWAYKAAPTAAANETTTPLLTAAGYTVAATHTTAAGEQTLALTFDNYPTLLHSLALNYGIINWVTNGVFLGSRKIYLSPQIDDMLIGDRLYAPTLPQCPNNSDCPTVRTTPADLQALDAWQWRLQHDARFGSYLNTFSYAGIGTSADYSPSGDPLLPAVTQLALHFGWISHTYSHSNLDCYTTTNGRCNPATQAQSLSEIQQNLAVASTLGISVDTGGIVTPYNSGLSNTSFLAAAVQQGIQSVIYPGYGPSPNTGIVDAANPAIFEVPRLYTNLLDDVSSPTPGAYGSWPDEFNATYGPGGTNPLFTQNQTYSQILDNESDNVLLLNMLTGQLTPLGFHISNIFAYDGTHSLYTDLMDATFAKYDALFTLPVMTLKMSDMTPLLQARAGYDASAVTGVYTPGVSVVLTTVKPATIPITGACSQANCPTYGGQLQDSVSMGANSSVTLYLNAGAGVTLASLSLNPAAVGGGDSSVGTVTLTGPAPSGGVVVGLASNSAAATVPATIAIGAGGLSATFSVATTAVGAITTATITASYAGATKTAALSINPGVALSSVSFNPTAVIAGNSSTGTVTLTGLVSSGFVVINLSSDSPSATVPGAVSVSPGSSSATFTVTTKAGSSSTVATITATYNGINATAQLTINAPAALSSISLNPATVTAGASSTGTLTLTAAAPAGGILVGLSSNSAAATVPVSVSVAAGNSSATFSVATKAVTSPTAATITASYAGLTRNATLTINPAVALSSVSLNPTSVIAGNSSTGTVRLTSLVTSGFAVINLSSNSSSATVPGTVSVSPGSSSATFTVTTKAGSSSTVATITATYNGINATAQLTINAPAALSSISLNPASVTGGASSTGTVTLTAPAPAGGLLVALTSNSASATVPASVNLAAGNSSVTFTVATKAVTSATAATITATYNGLSKTAQLNIAPTARLASLSLNPSAVKAGGRSTGTVTLNGPAPAGGAKIAITSSVPFIATVPSTVTVAAGATSASFAVTTHAYFFATWNVVVTATYNGGSLSANLTVSR